MSLLGATILTAVATLALAVFAFITAIFAWLAFRKQSREVSDQAKMLKLQSDQLEDQRKINAEQTSVLKLQARELRASLDAREQESLVLRQQYASTVVAWQDVPRPTSAGNWRIVARVDNTGDRPVRDVSARWYSGGKPIRDPELLTTCLMPKQGEDFNCQVGDPSIRAGVTAIIQFRTVGDDWWSAGTDGSLVGGMEVADAPLLAAVDDGAQQT